MSSEQGRLFIGVDIGGTFTDLVVMDAEGNTSTAKALSTPHATDEGVFSALEFAASERGETLEQLLPQVAAFGYGTTQATNAVIERSGARTGLITTRGFGDTIFLQRLLGMTAGTPVSELGWYSRRRYPEPIVPRRRVREVPERVDQAGSVLLPLDEKQARAALRELLEEGIEALAVSLLWSFRNPGHERRIAELARQLGGEALFVSVSSDVSPVIGEYERTATTVLNAYLGPKVKGYLTRLEERLRDSGFRGAFSVLNSIGGVMGAQAAAEKAVVLVASGPTGGVIGSRYLAEALGHENVITTDMGGTSFDVGLIVDGRPLVSPVTEVARYHVAAPMLDIRAIGAGGGSIATVADGRIRVGPESAGADPGPVCYGRGGTRATVSDADLVLGILDPDRFLGGRMKLDREAAERAIEEQIARPLGIGVLDAAAGIRRIVDSQMADVLREMTIGRGHDPRDFVLYAYGGAGPMHCAGYGDELGVAQIVIPSTAMVQSAYGALASDVHHAAERTHIVRGGGAGRPGWQGIDADELEAQFRELEQQCREAVSEHLLDGDDLTLRRSCDMRYRRQQNELIVPVDALASTDDVRALVERFEASYEATYGKGSGHRDAGIEIITLRVDAVVRTRKPKLARGSVGGAAAARKREIYEWHTGRREAATVLDWSALAPTERIAGPAVIEHPTTTVYVSAGQEASVDEFGNIVLQPSRRVAAALPGAPAGVGVGLDAAVDPITFEVVRNKLIAIAEEMAITLKSVSGSPVVVGANDFNNGIYGADGSVVTMGAHILFHSATMSSVVRSIISEYSENPGIGDGDMFILNDPYRGAVHQHDVTIVAPVFHEGRRVAWAGTCAHQLDVGGMVFGSWSLKATEVQQEAMLLPGVKIVEGGELRNDIWQLVMGMTRLPAVVGLDLKAMIAANRVAGRRITELIDRYSIGVVDAVMAAEQDISEQQFRARLSSLPDGTFRAVDFIDHDGHENRLYEIRTAVHKHGDELRFDMSGSSPQAPGFINCTRHGLRSALFSSLLPILAPDIRWNDGLMRTVTVDAPEASIVSAERPAPVSMASVGAMWVVANVGVIALSRLVAGLPAMREEASAVTKGAIQILVLSGLDRAGAPWGTPLLDAMAGGGGAHVHRDGLDGGGDYSVPLPQIGNVETLEAEARLLYLYRRFVPDTGGPGRMRGGASLGLAVTPHDADALQAMLVSHGFEVPNSSGLFGGFEGSCNDNALIAFDEGQASPKDLLAGTSSEKTRRPLGAKPGFFSLAAGHVFEYSFQGGGGYGDPLQREPERVLRDVAEGFVSMAAAERHYGVVIRDGAIDRDATSAWRAAIRTERLGGKPPVRDASRWLEDAPVAFIIGDSLAVDLEGNLRCGCGFGLGPSTGDFKDHARTRVVDPSEHGRLRLHDELELREHVCPECGALLESEVARKLAAHLHSIEIALPAAKETAPQDAREEVYGKAAH